MAMNRSVVLCTLLLFQLLGLGLYLQGFFPLKKAIPGAASHLDNPAEPGSAQAAHPLPIVFDKLVIVLVDAMRADFVFEGERMKYTCGLIENNHTLSFVGIANSPTVTMPRIKGLMTGGIPGFVDVLCDPTNLAGLNEDNILTQAKSAGKKIVFYGPEEWIKLFPGHFIRSHGISPFYVTDYTEVDNNVTQHLSKELQSTDWDIMILHYSGLDHIGHREGPGSPLMGPKLQEMDQIVERIHQSLINGDRERGTNSLMLLCGDHGMSDTGSHGGASLLEISTPFVFMSSRFQTGEVSGSKFSNTKVDQIDLVSTLSILFGLPIPKNSVGSLMPAFLAFHTSREKLRAYQLNAYQLTKVMTTNGHSPDMIWELEEAERLHKQWLEAMEKGRKDEKSLDIQAQQVAKQYGLALKKISSKISASLSCYDLHAMVSGIIILVQVLGWLVYGDVHGSENIKHTFSMQEFVPSATTLLTMGVTLMIVLGVHITVCSSALVSGTCNSENLCSTKPSSIFFSLVLIIFTTVTLSNITNNITMTTSLHYIKDVTRKVFSSPLNGFIISGTVFHVLSLLSSSFVEEEHQTWYFFVITFFLWNLWDSMKYLLKEMKERKMDNNRTSFLYLLVPLLCLILVRISRKWNQTGDKWAHLPDIGDWLVLAENRVILSIVVSSSLFVITFMSFRNNNIASCLVQGLGLLCVLNYRAVTGTVALPWRDNQSTTHGVTEARLVYISSMSLLLMSFVKLYKANNYRNTGRHRKFAVYKDMLKQAVETFFMALLVVEALLLRTHNIALLAVFVVEEWCLRKYIFSGTNASSWSTMLVYYWLGQAAYFAQGNSNSLSTIDVAAAYVGMEEHNSTAFVLLVAIVTYCGPFLWLTALIKLIVDNSTSQKQLRDSLYRVCVTLSLPNSLLLCVYTTLVYGQRYHLFVWSVFSPKLLCDTMRTLVMFLSVVVVLGFRFVIHRSQKLEQDKVK